MRDKTTVHYLSLRSIPEFFREKRRNPPSGQKQDYIISCLTDLGYKVNYVSFSESMNNRLYFPKKKALSETVTFFLCPHIPCKYRESFSFRWFYHIYAPKYINKGDVLLVYHTNSMRNDILRRLADEMELTLIYEVEEIYAFAHEQVDNEMVEYEKNFLQCADKYLFCSELLAQFVNLRKKPYTVVEGYYHYVKSKATERDDNNIHCVYGGIIDRIKGGAYRAVDAACYLPENYVIHILGFGDTNGIKKYIEDTSLKRKCQVIFEGTKNGTDYIDFISKCDIGLSLMTLREDINNTAFPSKLVLYMACGLRVVAGRVKVLEFSKMNEHLYFYDKDEPMEIAKAILSIDVNEEYDSKAIMDLLDMKFRSELQELLNCKKGVRR